ncbi:hypothetical protein LZ32DRAFT_660650 [Colletotrichum eremochloae]|nr:hypothetical protein LZ32DRAFT_660650 [Colletotrichum eremochloae]
MARPASRPSCERPAVTTSRTTTANIMYFATTRAVNECQSLRHLLSPQAKETMAQEGVDAVYLAGDIIDTRYASKDSLGDGI